MTTLVKPPKDIGSFHRAGSRRATSEGILRKYTQAACHDGRKEANVNQTEWVIDTHGLSKSYKQIHALKGLDLRVPQHSIFGFLGPNGAGKTTTIKLLLGLIRPTAARQVSSGSTPVRDSVGIRARIGYLPQDPRFYEHMTARQILDYTAHFFFRGPQSGNRRTGGRDAGAGRVVGQGRPADQGLFGRRAPAVGHRAGAGELSGPADPRRTRGLARSRWAGTTCSR